MLDRIKIATFLLGSVVAIPFFASPEFRSFLDRSAFEIGLTDQNTGRLGNLFAPDIREEVPPVGTGRVLSRRQIRYCLFQVARLEYMMPLVTTASQSIRLDEAIDDYNSRCSDFQYRAGNLRPVQEQVEEMRPQLQAEAERIMAAWL